MKKKNNQHHDLSEELKRLSLSDAAKYSSFLFQQPLNPSKIDGDKLCEQLLDADMDSGLRKRLARFREQVKDLLSAFVLLVSSSVFI